MRYDAAVRNAEARINLLVNDPHLYGSDHVELIPIQYPHLQYPYIGVRDSLITALHNRPEVDQSLQQIKAASVREQVAQKDLLPVLDAVLSVYAMGLEGDSRMGQAFVDQFTTGEPGYTTGLQFEVPLGNRLAKARLLKRQLECQQFSLQLKQTVAVLVEEVEIAVRNVDASFHEAQSQYLAMQAADTEIRYLEARWRLLPSEDQVAGIMLEDLLAAQERYGNAEFNFATALVAYNISLANWNRATGVLLKCLPATPAPQKMPPEKGIEEIPSPPSQAIPPAPAPPPPPPPDLTNRAAPAAGAASTNNGPVLAQANNNNATWGTGRSQLAEMRSRSSHGEPQGGLEAAPFPPPYRALAPLPPALTNSRVAAGTASTNSAPTTAQANYYSAAKVVDKSQTAAVRTDQGTSPRGEAEAAPLPPPCQAPAPLPPAIANVPTAAAAPTKDIIKQ